MLSATPVLTGLPDNQTIDAGVPLDLLVSFFDEDPDDVHSAIIDWGDGTVATGAVTPQVPASPLAVEFRYDFDTNGFFDPLTTDGQTAHDLLELAAEMVAGAIQDELRPIIPGNGNRWTATFTNPSTRMVQKIDNLRVKKNQIIIFAGAADFMDHLGVGGPGGFAANGSHAWIKHVRGRGVARAVGANPSEMSLWGGAISFDVNTNWHFRETTDGLNNKELDFLSVAVHELAHVFGFGNTPDGGGKTPWSRHILDDEFRGPTSMAVFGDPVPLDPDGGHWREGTRSGKNQNKETAMDPTLRPGKRKLLTELDLAGLADIGWDIDPDVQQDGQLAATHAFPSPGVFTVRTTVTDQHGDATTDTFSVTVNPVPPPEIDAFLTATSDSGTRHDGITNDNTPRYRVTVNSGGIVTADWNGDGVVDDTVVIKTADRFNFTPSVALPDGVMPIDIRFHNPLGSAAVSLPTTIDTTPPTIQDASPAGIVFDDLSQITLTFSEDVGLDATSATDPANYQLAGVLGQDEFIPNHAVDLTATIGGIRFDVPTQTATLTMAEPLASGAYRLRINGSQTVTDQAGNPLDGDRDGIAGGDHLLDFVLNPTIVVGDDALRQLTIIDHDDTRTIVRMKGGRAGVTFKGENLQVDTNQRGTGGNDNMIIIGENVRFSDITVTPSTPTGNLVIDARNGKGFIEAQNIHINGSLSALRAKTVNLLGSIKVTGTLRTLSLGNVAHDHLIEIGDPLLSQHTVKITLGDVEDLQIVSRTPIRTLNVMRWRDRNPKISPDLIDAPSIGRLIVTGDQPRRIAGDFQASLRLNADGTSTAKLALGAAKVSGSLGSNTPSTWLIHGDAGAIASGDVSNWTLDVSADVKSLKLGRVTASTVDLEGDAGLISMTQWDGGMIKAASLGRLKSLIAKHGATGNGDVNVDLRLNENSSEPLPLAIRTVRITGRIIGGTWFVNGGAGKVTAHSIGEGFSATIAGTLTGIATRYDAGGDIAARTLKRAKVGGDLRRARWLAGVQFGLDGMIGGGDDHFGPGRFESLTVVGQAMKTLIGAGIAPAGPGDILTDFTSEAMIVDPATNIVRRMTLRGGADADSRFIAGAFPKTITVGDRKIDPLSDERFRVNPS